MRALFVALSLASLSAQDVLSDPGLNHFYNLEYDQALAIFEKQLAANPTSAGLHNRVAQVVLFREMYRTGALETELVSGANPFLRREKLNPSAEDQKRFDTAILRAIELSEARLAQNPKDVQALYALGVAHGLRANYNFLVRKAWRDALRDATRARKLHNQATDLDPGFVDARLIQGIHDYVVGSLPLHWKILGFLAGFRGDRERGLETLKTVAAKGKGNALDAQIFLAALYRRERRPAEAIPLLESLIAKLPRNHLLPLELAYMYGDLGHKAKWTAVLDRLEEQQRASAPGIRRVAPEKIRYVRGNLLFWHNDLDRAIEELSAVTPHADKLDLNTAVLASMRLGQAYDLKGERKLAIAAYQRAVELAPESEAGKESRRYMSSRYRR